MSFNNICRESDNKIDEKIIMKIISVKSNVNDQRYKLKKKSFEKKCHVKKDITSKSFLISISGQML